MDYQIILSPTLSMSPETFIAAWNDDPDCRATALATRIDAPPAGYPLDPGTVLIFLGGVATTIATGVLTNLISKLLEQKLVKPAQTSPSYNIVVVEPAPDTRLLVVTGPE